jgi:hypothetical protein
MLAVESVGNPTLGIDEVDDLVSVLLLTGRENHQLVKQRHLEQEGVQTESLRREDTRSLPAEDHLRLEVELRRPREGSVDKSFVEVEDQHATLLDLWG